MTESKPRTWPAALVEVSSGHWNVRQLDGSMAFTNPTRDVTVAKEARDAINRAFDWGRDA